MLKEKTVLRFGMISVLALLLLACGKAPPPAVLQTIEANTLQEADWKGKWIYINYWAEWCKPCAEEIPELNKFAAERKNVLVLGVNFDNPEITTALQQMGRMRIEFPVVTNDSVQAVFPHTVPQGLPGTIVINPEGKILKTLQGPQTESTLLQAQTSH
ncbi:MAG: TlpA disulfide reductase family protein [Pseudomonadales bacterium]